MIKKKIVLIALLIVTAHLFAQVQVDKFTGDANYGLPLITIPNFRGPSVSTSISYRSDVKADQSASEVGLGWNIQAGGAIERIVNGVVDDWKDVDVPSGKSVAFLKHLGALYLNASTASSKVLDFNYNRFKMDTLNDTLRYYYPDYDSYFVSGAGMDGEIAPENYDFSTIQAKQVDSFYLENSFKYKAHFQYKHGTYDELDATYYPWDESPITSSTPVYIPADTVGSSNTTFNGSGYHDENYSVVANRNRRRTANYIEYFTNEEIDGGITNFMEYDTNFDRSIEADFPQDGIGAFRITDPNGFTYHYSLPVYAHYDLKGRASLDKDYFLRVAQATPIEITNETKGYAIYDEYNFEIKQNKKYAIRWLLTAVTGPDFNDVNSNGIVDIDDEGYWVSYDYSLWVNSFIKAFPNYGGTYSYSSSIDEKISSRYRAENDSWKVSDKVLNYSETAEQMYYLNHIQTPSHTAIFARDLRYDEQSMPFNLEATVYDGGNIDHTPDSVYIDDHVGSLRFLDNVTSGTSVDFTLLIEPDGYETSYDVINFDFRTFLTPDDVEFTITVYDGATTTGTVLLDKEDGDGYGIYSLSATEGAILIKVTINPWQDPVKLYWTGISFDVDWNTSLDNALTGWPNGRQKTIPQLKLSNVLLFDNDDLGDLPSLTAIDTITNDQLWNYDSLNRAGVYNGDWYRDHQGEIDSLALQTVELQQDYSLAKKYDNNRYVLVNANSKAVTAIEVEANKYVNTTNISSSGKLTLNKVVYYGLNGQQVAPSHLFDYNASDTTDNPNYNSLLQDYWGNYKSDGIGNLLRGYVTDASKTRNDAWSLRTITSPLGGTTEIIYESDEYEQVLSEDNGVSLRGAIKTFALKDVVADVDSIGVEWTFDIENQATEFWNLYDNLPQGASHYTVVPCVWVDDDSNLETGDYTYIDPLFLTEEDLQNYWGGAVSYGTGVLKESTLEIDSLNYYELNGVASSSAVLGHPLGGGSSDLLVYSGGGYVTYEYPLGEKVYGGGTRVKELKISDGSATYTTSYSYDKGTATSESGDFSKRKRKKSCYDYGSGDCEYWYDRGLISYDYNPLGLNPQVGYGQVIIENKGQVSAGEGKSIFSFHVLEEEKNYFEPYIIRYDTSHTIVDGCGGEHCCSDGTLIQGRYAIEIIDDFTSSWGKIKEEILKDINGVSISKKVYEYESSSNGAEVSVLNYKVDTTTNSGCLDYDVYLVCIFRSYPNYLSKVTTYSNGRASTSEIIERDPLTTSPILVKTTSINGTIGQKETILAYTQNSTPDYEIMGAKSDDPSYDNFLNSTYSSKELRASEGITTSDFLSHGKAFWKQVAKIRYYDDSDDKYTYRTDSVEWYNYVNYGWTGDLGDYGLFDSTAFSDISSPPTGTSDWRVGTEITLLDEEQNVLEQKGYNDRFSASKLGYENRFMYTSASNANYVSFTATGFETETEVETGVKYYEGEILKSSGCACSRLPVDASVYPHTGNYMLKLANGYDEGVIYVTKFDTAASDSMYSLQRGRTYTASVWVHQNSVAATMLTIELDGDDSGGSYYEADTMSLANSAAIQIGDWVQLTVNLEVPSDFTSNTNGQGLKVYVDKPSSGDAWIDDLQFKSRVTGSGMNVYDQRTGRVMATLSDNNFATKYIYNDVGQVTEVWKEVLTESATLGKWVKVESKTTHFQREMEQ